LTRFAPCTNCANESTRMPALKPNIGLFEAVSLRTTQSTFQKSRRTSFQCSPPKAYLEYFLGRPASENIPCVSYINYDIEAADIAFQKHGGRKGFDQLRIEVKLHPGLLAKMLAKIAHAYAVSQIGLTFRPFLQSYILDDKLPINTHLIGNFTLDKQPYIHLISLFQYPVIETRPSGLSIPKKYWMVRLQLFTWRCPLVHFIVVGE
jgi:hypothetical protein